MSRFNSKIPQGLHYPFKRFPTYCLPTMLKELRSQHRNIIQMAFNGYKNQEIAERLGMAESTVSTILRSPLGQAYLNGLQDRAHEATLDVRKKLVSLNKAALETFTRLLDPKEKKVPHSVQFNAAKDVLDRNGYKAPDRLNIDMTLQTKTDEELDAEIAAIEASIKRSTGIKNLPEIKPSPLQPAPTNITSSKGDKFVVVPSIPSAPCSPALFVDASEEDLSLEDFPHCEPYNLEDLNNFAEDSSLNEPPLVEDPAVLEDLNFDPFHNIKRP